MFYSLAKIGNIYVKSVIKSTKEDCEKFQYNDFFTNSSDILNKNKKNAPAKPMRFVSYLYLNSNTKVVSI